jgi:hypothetical protein
MGQENTANENNTWKFACNLVSAASGLPCAMFGLVPRIPLFQSPV